MSASDERQSTVAEGRNGPGNGSTKGRWLKILGGLGVFLLAFGGKLKFLLPLLSLLKLGKIGGTIWSMMLMMGTYALIYPWQFAVGLVLMIFIHEMGHVLAARLKGLPVSAPAFIPFVGAFITMKRSPQDAATEAYIAYGGPLLGSIGAFLCLWLGRSLEMPLLVLVAWFGFFLNLINLLPIHPLDGGRIVVAISRWLWVVGLVAGLVVVLWLRSVIFGLIWLLFVWQLVQHWRRRKHPLQVVATEAAVPAERFEEAELPLPGPEHRRELDFSFYSRVDDRQSYCEVFYPGLGTLAAIPFAGGYVTGVRMTGVTAAEPETAAGPETVRVRLEITYRPDESQFPIREDAYYRVPPRVRLAYGLAYFGLLIVLSVFFVMTRELLPEGNEEPF